MIKTLFVLTLPNENNKNIILLIRKSKSRNLEVSTAITINGHVTRITSWRRTSRVRMLILLKSEETQKYFLENVRYLIEGGFNGQ